MRLDYTKHTDGEQVTVRTGSVLGWLWRVIRWAVALWLVLTLVGDLAAGSWGAAGWCGVLLFVVVPKRRKRRETR